MFEEYFSDSVVAEEKFEQLKVQVDNGEYDEICLDDETNPDDIDMIDCYPTVSDDEQEEKEIEEDSKEMVEMQAGLRAKFGENLTKEQFDVFTPIQFDVFTFITDKIRGIMQEVAEMSSEEFVPFFRGLKRAMEQEKKDRLTTDEEGEENVMEMVEEAVGANGTPKKEYSVRVQNVLRELANLFDESPEEYKSVFGLMEAKIKSLSFPKCSCGVSLRIKTLRDGGKCVKCLSKTPCSVCGGRMKAPSFERGYCGKCHEKTPEKRALLKEETEKKAMETEELLKLRAEKKAIQEEEAGARE